MSDDKRKAAPASAAVRRRVTVGGMAEASYGMATLERMRDEGLGDYVVLFVGPWSLERLREVVAFCRRNGMRFVMDEMWRRTQPAPRPGYAGLDQEAFRALLAEAGDVFDGTLFLCEYGGLALYWPDATVAGSPNLIEATPCAAEAKARLVAKLKELAAAATAWLVPRPLVLIEASPVARYLYEAGIDRVDLEITYDRFTEMQYAATRGATRAYGRPRFGVDMAMVCYGGNVHDALWRHRWKTSLYQAFIRGADPIYAEHGIMDNCHRGHHLDAEAPAVRTFRGELGRFARFCAAHPRPAGFPRTRLAVLHGHLDSFAPSGVGQTHVWGQRGPTGVPVGEPEASWELFHSLFQSRPWEHPCAEGDADRSGNPPLGQVDLLPAERPLEAWRPYSAVVCLGWNTMTPGIYATMAAYVRQGGHVLASLAHLDTRTRRDAPPRLVHDGDLHELFGVRVRGGDAWCGEGIKFLRRPSRGDYRFPLWTEICDPLYRDGGFPKTGLEVTTAEVLAGGSDRYGDGARIAADPVLTANRHGDGLAMLLNATAYPAHSGLRRLYTDLLGFVAEAQADALQVVCSDRIRYAVYDEPGVEVLYLLNTHPDCAQEARISRGALRDAAVTVAPGALRAVYLNDGGLVSPENPAARVTAVAWRGGRAVPTFWSDAVVPGRVDAAAVPGCP